MDVIEGLLRIKRLREDTREAEMRHAKLQFELASQAMQRAIDEQKRRDRERQEREKALYDDVCSRVVVVRELNDLGHDIDAMKAAAKKDADAVTESQAQRTKRRDAFDASVGAWRLAARATQRFEDLAAEQREEQAREAERLAELELEEHPTRGPLLQILEEEAEGA